MGRPSSLSASPGQAACHGVVRRKKTEGNQILGETAVPVKTALIQHRATQGKILGIGFLVHRSCSIGVSEGGWIMDQ
jgi:hypothetical protein